MSSVLRSRLNRAKRALKPHALRILGGLPVTARFSGLGHILMFHRVVPPEQLSPYGMAAFEITPQALEMTVSFFLKRGYKIISLDEVCDRLAHGDTTEKFLVLTFDDGYKDTLTHALPILKRYESPFTVYVSVGYTERTAIKWDYLAEDLVHRHDSLVLDTEGMKVELDCSTLERKRRSCGRLQDILYGMSGSQSTEDMERFFAPYARNVFDTTDALMLDWAQVEELARDPLVTIGAHSVNHRVLSRLSESDARDEIDRSKTMLEARLDHQVTHFSYPFGRLHEAAEREYSMARHCGFKTGVTGIKGNVFPEYAVRLHSLPRFCLGSNCTEPYLAAISNGSLPFLVNGLRRSENVPFQQK